MNIDTAHEIHLILREAQFQSRMIFGIAVLVSVIAFVLVYTQIK